MSMVQITLVKDDLTPFMANMRKKSPRAFSDFVFNVAKMAEMNLKESVVKNNIIDQGDLYRKIQARRKSKFVGEVFVPKTGVYLDSMRTHWVSLKPGRSITEWAKRNLRTRNLPSAIQVHKHPWIEEPLMKTRVQTPRLMRDAMRMMIKR